MLKGIVLSAGLISLWIAVHILVIQIFRPKLVFQMSTKLFAATIPLFFLIYLFTPADLYVLPEQYCRASSVLGILNGLLVHFLLCYSWWQFFFPVDRSLTLRILVEYSRAPGGSLTYEHLRSIYSFDQIIERRMDDMLQNGYINDAGEGRYILTRQGELMAKAFLVFRKIFKVPFYLLDDR